MASTALVQVPRAVPALQAAPGAHHGDGGREQKPYRISTFTHYAVATERTRIVRKARSAQHR